MENQFKVSFIKNTNTFTPSMKKINNIMKTNMNPLDPYEFYDEIILLSGSIYIGIIVVKLIYT